MARIQLKNSGVVFLEEPHQYFLGDKQLSGITEMLQRQLFPDEYKNVPWAIVKKAGEYGTDVHKRIEKFDSQWINDGTQEVKDYISLCKEYGLTHEASEYTVTDGITWASNIDKVFRTGDDTFDIADVKTYSKINPTQLAKVRWQLSIYAYLFELVNKKAKVGRLVVLHIRNKEKKDGTIDHYSEFIEVERIPVDIVKSLLEAEERGEQFLNPYDIPAEYAAQEERIRELLRKKSEIEDELGNIKSSFLGVMSKLNVKSWAMPSGLRLTRKLPSIRTTFNLPLFQSDHPELNYDAYMKTSNVSESITIAI